MRAADRGFSVGRLHEILQTLGLRPGVRMHVAYSGGVDSHVLLHALTALRNGLGGQSNPELHAIHIDHGIHPESHRWAAHCRAVCEQLGVACSVESIQVPAGSPEGLEAAARRLRYARLKTRVAAGDWLLTAHHQDDQAETLLLQLLRGAGLPGLAAMPPTAPFGPGKLVRPMLDFSRAQLLDYARDRSLSWIEDDSNHNRRFARNYIRQALMPTVRQRWPRADQLLARSARHAADAMAVLDEVGQQDLAACQSAGGRLDVSVLVGLSEARLRNVLRVWIRQAGFRPPNRRHLLEIIEYVHRPTRSRHAIVRWSEAEVRRYRDQLQVMPRLAAVEPLHLAWDARQPLIVPGTGYRLSWRPAVGEGLARAALFDMPVTVRLRRGGESCRLPGQTHHHKLKKLMQESGMPPWERERLPLVYVGETLAAIGDRWVCEPFAARPGQEGACLIVEPSTL